LENFHTVTLIHMLRKFHFDEFLGGDFASAFRERPASIRFFISAKSVTNAKCRLMSVARMDGLIKCADISNPVSGGSTLRL
jgi:hypothetical protein